MYQEDKRTCKTEEPNRLWGDSPRPTRAREAKKCYPKIGTEKSRQKYLLMGRNVDQARRPIREKEWAPERNREYEDQRREDLEEDETNEEWNDTAPRTGQPENKGITGHKGGTKSPTPRRYKPTRGSRNHEARQPKTLPSRWKTERNPWHRDQENVHNA